MSEKQELIQQMIQMQKAFIKKEHESGVSSEEYYLPDEDSTLSGYNEKYEKMATRLVDLAHEEKASSR